MRRNHLRTVASLPTPTSFFITLNLYPGIFFISFRSNPALGNFVYFFIQKSIKSWQLNPFLSKNDRSWQHNSFFFWQGPSRYSQPNSFFFCQERSRSWQLNSFFFHRSAPDLGNFSIMYGIVFGAFCQLAYLFFGTQLEDYASLKWSG